MADGKDSRDEKVNGARIAAQILMRMPPENQKKIVAQIQRTQPELAEKIAENFVRVEDLAELTPNSMQTLLKEVDQRDVVITLKSAAPPIREAILQTVSERRQEMLQEDIGNLSELSPAEVESAKRRILLKLDQLRELGKVRSETKKSTWA